MQFRTRPVDSITLSLPFFLLGIILIFYPSVRFYSPFILLLGFFLYFNVRLRKLTTDESGISHKIPFKKTINIKWEEIYSIKSPKSHFQNSVVVCWGKPEKRFWTFKSANRLFISRTFDGFPDILRLVISKSVNATIDPLVYSVFEKPDIQKIRKTDRKLGYFLLFTSAAFIWLLSSFISSRFSETVGSKTLILSGLFFLPYVFSTLGMFFCLARSRWDGDKWEFLEIVYFLLMFFLLSYKTEILFSPAILSIQIMLGLVSVMIFTCVLAFSPHLKNKQILLLFVVLVLIIWKGGTYYLLPHGKTQFFQKIDNFWGLSAGWFPDGSKIYIEGKEDTERDTEEGQYKMLIFDVATKKLLKTIVTNDVLPWSCQWSLDGNNLALVEYSYGDSSALFLVNTKTLQKEPLLEKSSIRLFPDGCWNQNSSKLAGTYWTKRGDKEKRVVFVVDINTRQVKTYEEKDDINNAFWFVDGALGMLRNETKKEAKNELHKYSIIRIKSDREKETIYTTKEWFKRAVISPRGSFLFLETQEERPLIVNVFGNSQDLPFRQEYLVSPGVYGVYWSPNEKHAVFSLKEGKQDRSIVYDPQNKTFREILPNTKKKLLFSTKWSGNSQWFLDWSTPSIFLFSRDGINSTKVGLIIGFTNFMGSLLDTGGRGLGFQYAPNYDGTKVVYFDYTVFRLGKKKQEFRMTTDILLAEVKGKS